MISPSSKIGRLARLPRLLTTTLGAAMLSTSLPAQEPNAPKPADDKGAAPVQAGLPPLIPLEDFFRKPEKAGYQLSPSGEYIAFMAPWKDRMNINVIAVADLEKGEAKRITSVEDQDLGGYFWESDDTIVYVKDTHGDENNHLWAVPRAGGEPRDLTPFPGVKARIVDDLEDRDDEILVSLNKRDPKIFDVFRLKLSTGALEVVAENPGNIAGWMTDHDGKLRAAVTSDGVNSTLLYRDTEAEKFRPLITTDFRTSVDPELFTFDNKQLIVNSNLNRDKSVIVEYDPATGKEGKVIYENPDVDAGGVIYSKKRSVLQAVVYETDKSHYHFLDKEREELQTFLEAQFPGQEVFGRHRNRNEDRMIFAVASDRNPGTNYLIDIKTRKITKLAEAMPWIKAEQMAEMKHISYKSRDGLMINGYLTLPTGMERKNLPVIVNPHGGPWVRDGWGYSGETQFLANRGYAILNMNYRGSTGYGRKFWEAGFKQWGRAMQDDVTDGVKWLVAEGIADPKRVAIYGASYGGYATLAGLAFTPDVYAAGVDYVGVSNLLTFMNTMPPYWELFRQMMYEQVGNPETERDLLVAASPFFHVDKIVAPLFVAQGKNDPRVNKAESDQIVRALRARGIQVPYMVKDNEGHGFSNQENQFEFYKAMEAFLAKYIGGRTETPESVLEPLMKTPTPAEEEKPKEEPAAATPTGSEAK